MKVGAHISTAGGLFKAYQRGEDVGCETMLIFTKSNRSWKAKDITEKEVEKFEETAKKFPHITPISVHASYLINMGSPKPDLWEKSYNGFIDEITRAATYGIPMITFHPGSHVGSGEEAGLDGIVRGLKRMLDELADLENAPTVCLETMAGQGTNLGYKFEHLAYMLENADGGDRLGVTMDTCHIFAAGYDIRTPEAYETTMAEFDRIVGLDQIKNFHFNDSKFDIGEKKDRHAHIGQGFIGEQGFANFMQDPRWVNHAAHVETPKTEEDDEGVEVEMDPINLAVLKGLRISN